MVRSLLSLTEVGDADTGSHSRRIQQYSRLLAEELAKHRSFRNYLTPERIDLLSSLAPVVDAFVRVAARLSEVTRAIANR